MLPKTGCWLCSIVTQYQGGKGTTQQGRAKQDGAHSRAGGEIRRDDQHANFCEWNREEGSKVAGWEEVKEGEWQQDQNERSPFSFGEKRGKVVS